MDCPIETELLGPVIRDWFEFDVVVPAGPRVVPVDPESVGNDETDEEQRFEQKFMAQYAQPLGAIATAIRRAADPADSP